jgi:predicted RNase H-like nuclease
LGGAPLTHGKRTRAGREERLRLLLGEVPDAVRHLAPVPRGAAADDVLDALAVAITMRRVAAGRAHVVGDDRTDARGHPMRVVLG